MARKKDIEHYSLFLYVISRHCCVFSCDHIDWLLEFQKVFSHPCSVLDRPIKLTCIVAYRNIKPDKNPASRAGWNNS